MQYRHSYHAGNFADVHKHILLIALLDALARKEKGYFYLDTHAGRGLYDLASEEARHSGESRGGIERLLHASAPVEPEIVRLLELLKRQRELGTSHDYPGSALLAAQCLRPQDRGIAIESQAPEARALNRALRYTAGMRAQQGDGFERLVALLPPAERRGLAFVDPPFEEHADFERTIAGIESAAMKFPGGVYAAWYPIKRQREVDHWLNGVTRRLQGLGSAATGPPPALVAQFWLRPRDSTAGLNGSGMLVVNPPWQFDTRLPLWQGELQQLLQTDANAGNETRWLIDERP
ncbi:MAG: 23S rRNA (adenine(2030)-N(6))-methyltransferase RlmJ [Steroidobacteraceae bacterium]